MNEVETAVKNLQSLIDTGIKKGLFENAATVIAMQNSLNFLASLKKPADKAAE